MIQMRCDRGASIVRKIGLSEETALAVRALDEHWDGSGYPERSTGTAISPLARVMAVAQHLDVFALERGPAMAMQVLRQRTGRWFDPEVTKAAESLHRKGALWMHCLPSSSESPAQSQRFTRSAVLDLAPPQTAGTSPSHIDTICEAFAEVVDAKSHFTFSHSVGVTWVAAAIGEAMGLNPQRKQLLHRAALLHDLGKLRVPNSILDKPRNLDTDEWQIMREHPGLTASILRRVKQFRELASIAGAHHERLDGSGYPDGLYAQDIPLETRILTVSDIYTALTEDRPYRAGYSHEQAIEIMIHEGPGKLDDDCFAALRNAAQALNWNTAALAQPTVPPAMLAHTSRGSDRIDPEPSVSIVQ
jgi:putative nucleotidyltransferase with HDIG domain